MLKYLILKIIRLYQKVFSPDQGLLALARPQGVCRFYPSCSQYCYRAIEKEGLIKGSWKGLRRLLRCHPWNPGGVDLP